MCPDSLLSIGRGDGKRLRQKNKEMRTWGIGHGDRGPACRPTTHALDAQMCCKAARPVMHTYNYVPSYIYNYLYFMVGV